MSPITSHVLDTALGRPATDLGVRLDVLESDGSFRTLGESATNAGGRVVDLLPEGALEAARTYRLVFATGPYFETRQLPVFYPRVEVIFTVLAAGEHHHVPLLLSPFGYSTYRGS